MHSPPAIMAKVIGRDTSSEAVSREVQRRAMDPDVADYEMDQVQPGSARSPITGVYEFQAADYPNPNPNPQRQRNGALRSADPGRLQAQQARRKQRRGERVRNAEYNPKTRSYDLDHTD